ncbi:MAG TPA: serine hydrolase domain-containing protein, partial [Thermomicrobiales bacterium]|nr:serine hydrolase domain-containing protein [Thermomicrobiales bacterium]
MRTNTQLTAAIRQIDDWIDPNGVSAAVISVRYQGAEIASHAAGMLKNGMPVREDTLFGLASVTKPITAAGVLALVDDGLVSLDEPVVRFLPEFGTPAADGNPEREAGRGLITVRQLLSHTSGLPEDLSSGVLPLRNQPTLTEISDAMMHAPLQFDPGTALRYSNCGYGVLGRLIERVTGEDIWAFVQSRILGPMNLQDIHARPNIAAYDRIATVLDV